MYVSTYLLYLDKEDDVKLNTGKSSSSFMSAVLSRFVDFNIDDGIVKKPVVSCGNEFPVVDLIS